MAKLRNGNRRKPTVMRDDRIHEMYKEITDEVGELCGYISRMYIYERIGKEMGISTRLVSFILNHTKHSKM